MTNLHTIKLDSLRDFFLLEGWQTADEENNVPIVFRSPEDEDGNYVDVVMPRSQASIDYDVFVRDALSIYSEVCNIEFQAALDKLLATSDSATDKLFIYAKTKEAKLPLPFAAQMVDAIRDLVYHGAATEFLKRPYRTGGGSPVAKHFLESCNFLPTVPGSFGFQIELNDISMPSKQAKDPAQIEIELQGVETKVVSVPPVAPEKIAELDDDDLKWLEEQESEPDSELPMIGQLFERRVLKRIVKGLQAVKQCEMDKSDEALIQSYDNGGFNGNMCLAVAKMFTMMDSPMIEFKPKYSAKEPVQDRSLLTPVALSVASEPFLQKAGKTMKSSVAASQFIELTGHVKELRHQQNKAERELRVILEGKDSSGKVHTVRVFLGPSQYAQACDAHKAETALRVSGQLEKIAGKWYLQQITNFEVLAMTDGP